MKSKFVPVLAFLVAIVLILHPHKWFDYLRRIVFHENYVAAVQPSSRLRYEDMPTVEYVASAVDPSSAEALIHGGKLRSRFGRGVSIKESDRPDKATNAILFGSSVKWSDVEFVREQPTETGIDFEKIERREEWTGEKSNKIQITSD